MSQESPALTIANRTALQVDDAEAKEYAKQLLTHASAGNALFPKDMSQSQAVVLARLALAYGLDPIAGELIPYQGKAYVTIDGRIRKAQEHAAYDGIECNPATDDERKAFRCGDDEHLWIARVWRKDRRVPFVGYGRAGGKGDRNPVSREYGAEMAQKRAKARALRDAFSMPLPSYEDEEPRSPRPSVNYSAPVIEHEERTIDAETGVILEGEYSEPTANPQTAKIHVLIGKLHWDYAEYRTLLREAFGVDSSTELSEGQAAALSETLESLLAEYDAAEEYVRVSQAVAGIKLRAAKLRDLDGDDDPAWKREQDRRAALAAAGMDTVQESAAQQVTLTDAEYREIEPEQPPDVDPATLALAFVMGGGDAPSKETPGEKSEKSAALEKSLQQRRTAEQAQRIDEKTAPAGEKSKARVTAEENYATLMKAATDLGVDLAPFEIDSDVSDDDLNTRLAKLAAAVRIANERPREQVAP